MAKLNGSNLTDKQDMFCREYIVDFNATQAAIRSGYSKKTARQQADVLLTKLDIQEYITNLINERKEHTKQDGIDVVKEIQAYVNVDPKDMFEEVEEEVVKELPNGGNMTFLNKTHKPKPEYMKYFKAKIVHGKLSWEMWNKEKFIDMLAKCEGVYAPDKLNVNMVVDIELTDAVKDYLIKRTK